MPPDAVWRGEAAVDTKAVYVTILRAKLVEGFLVREIMGTYEDNFAGEVSPFDVLSHFLTKEKTGKEQS